MPEVYEYLSDVKANTMTFKVIKTYHAIERANERGLPLVEEGDVWRKIQEAANKIEASWIAKNGSPKFFREEFEGWINSKSLKLNIVFAARIDRKSGQPAIVILTSMVKHNWLPKARDLQFKVSKSDKEKKFIGQVYLKPVASTLIRLNPWLKKALQEDLSNRDLDELKDGWAFQFFGADKLTYSLENVAGKYYIGDINLMPGPPELIIQLK